MRNGDDDIVINEYYVVSGVFGVVRCDSVISDVYYFGICFFEVFEKIIILWINGIGEYCMMV